MAKNKIAWIKPKGRPSPLTKWHEPQGHGVRIVREDRGNWYGFPLDNPECPEVQYPKFAWDLIEFEGRRKNEAN